ncbi:conjugal transfer protein [Streptomyces sp. NPDC088732]|uniref:conjugal transfer protein n=1 Tax=Streptomyces sp. NPDC088732 TaxID=3365879 RepID=UPI0037F72D3C
MSSPQSLTKGQIGVLALAALPMIAVGVAGAIGTYANATSVLHRSETALGVVAAGEGATLVAALVMIGVTMLGQSAPTVIRAALWLLPSAAAVMGIAIAPTVREAIVYGMTPLAMTAAAEGISFLARRIVVHRTGVDAETLRRNASTVQQLAYHQARAVNHPSDWARKLSERKAWRLAKRVGVGDTELGARLVEVQRDRLREGADAALAGMYGGTLPELPAAEHQPEVTTLAEHFADAAEVVADAMAEVTIERAAPVPPPPPVVPAGARPLPIVARPKPRPELPPAIPVPVVMPPVAELPPPLYRWDNISGQLAAAKVTAALPAETPRQVVTETITLTPADLRREARKLDRDAVRSTRRRVTIQTLQTELGLSRRDATALRTEIVGGGGQA